jgi:hypothetical protein
MPHSARSGNPLKLQLVTAAAVLLLGALIALTQLPGGKPTSAVQLAASNSRSARQRPLPCPTTSTAVGPWSKSGTYLDHGATQHIGDGQEPPVTNCPQPTGTTAPTDPGSTDPASTDPAATDPASTDPAATDPASTDPAATDPAATDPAATTAPAPTIPATQPPLQILTKDCSQSQLPIHDGFQNGNRCVTTEFGEVGSDQQNPSLLIADAPRSVRVGQSFTIAVSTRNLIRDRFLAAGQGGYYAESSVLNAQGLVRGHFHTACRMLTSQTDAPDPAPVPAFFVATEDNGGGAAPDTVQVTVAGLPTTGTAQCAAWAGDGSHRVPMMQRANQIPAFDVVRIQVTG